MAKPKVIKFVLTEAQGHRLSFVHIKEAKSFEDGGDAKYDVTFLIPKGHPDIQLIKDTINACYKADKDNILEGMSIKHPKMWIPLRDGDEYIEEKILAGKPRPEEYAGMMYIKATSKDQPVCFNKAKQEILNLDEVYSGCFARAALAISAFKKKGNQGFSCYINSIMKIKDGTPLAGFSASADDYGDVPVTDDEDFDDEI